ncbi:armadillo repeat-containing protein 2 isoform X2 [Anolis sagrei]|uniref:armadillo repeat-containing protein 2 isoform X2 n=1 Tax=Anolis sagrei TaxID=38937 RepID=UPI003520FE6B
MQPSKNKKEYSEAFYKSPLAVQKTSAEIINEARNSLRTLRTQRPFTPREQQRKLFGSASSRTPENRPPSAFSLHASSFESVESRPVSCTRLSPLDHKPKLLPSATSEEEHPVSPAKIPVDSEEIRKVSNARAYLFKTASCGKLLPDKVLLPIESKRQSSEEQTAMGDISKNSNEHFTEKLTVQLNFKDEYVPLPYKANHSKIIGGDMCPKMTTISPASQFSNQSDLVKGEESPANTECSKPLNKSENCLEANETEEEENYWNVKILPILQQLEMDSLLEILRTEDLGTNTEAFLYCMGAIKFISGNARLLNEMVSKGSVEILLKLMKQINEIDENDPRFSSSGHILVQLTATLRNLVDLPQSRCKLLESGAIPELSLVLERYMSDKDVCTNVARIFSKLSSFNDCCAALADCSRCYVLFLALLNKHPKKQDLVVRIIFILGNLTAKNNQAREAFFEVQGSIDTLIALFQYHCDADANSKLWNDSGELKKLKHPSEAEDVLIKLIRVIANLSIHPSVGASLAANPQVVALLIKVLESKSVDECEELVINTTATINNLSFYQVHGSVIQEKKLYIAELLLKLLMSNNMDGILEAIRVFGNLSQCHEVCDFIMQRKVYKFMIALLDAKHQEVCFSACGVLLNLTVDKSRRSILNEGGGIKKLIDCLRDFGPMDWQLACLICKTLWNYSESFTSAQPCFEDHDSDTLLGLLTSFLDEELALDHNFDNDLRDYHKLYWETEFKPVAQKLLQKIQN